LEQICNRLLRLDLQGAKRGEARNRFILLDQPVTDSAAGSCRRGLGWHTWALRRSYSSNNRSIRATGFRRKAGRWAWWLPNNEEARRCGGLLWSL